MTSQIPEEATIDIDAEAEYEAVVWKNLQAHRMRNRKTAITYATALGFIIFLAVSADLQITNSSYTSLIRYGSQISIVGNPTLAHGDLGVQPADQLEAWAASEPDIADWAWVSFRLQVLNRINTTVWLSNLGQYVRYRPRGVTSFSTRSRCERPRDAGRGVGRSTTPRYNVYLSAMSAVSPNTFEVISSELLEIGLQDPSSTWTIGQQVRRVVADGIRGGGRRRPGDADGRTRSLHHRGRLPRVSFTGPEATMAL